MPVQVTGLTGIIAIAGGYYHTIALKGANVEIPDLTVSRITWTPSNFTDGQVVTLNATIGNIGSGNTTGGFSIRFLIDGSLLGEQNVSGLASGASINPTQEWTATPGQHTISTIVDVNNEVPESNESNNTLELNMAGFGLPDYII